MANKMVRSGPQIIDHPHFDSLLAGGGETQRQGEADLVADKQHAAGQQIAARDLAQVGKANGENEQQAAQAIKSSPRRRQGQALR